MDLDIYYAILRWRGENPNKIDAEDPLKKEFGRKIFDQDIALGKVAWTGHRVRDFQHYLMYFNPLLAMCSNLKHLDFGEMFIIISVMFNLSTFVAALTATLGFKTFAESNTLNTDSNILNSDAVLTLADIVIIAMIAAFDGAFLCFLSLNWRNFERYTERKIVSVIDSYNALIVAMFLAMTLNLGYYFVTQQMLFFSWFITIYALEVVFAGMFEFVCLRITFNRGWRRDIAMVELNVFVHYYLTYKDYQEWKEYLEQIKEERMDAVQDSDVTGDEESLLEEPLLNR